MRNASRLARGTVSSRLSYMEHEICAKSNAATSKNLSQNRADNEAQPTMQGQAHRARLMRTQNVVGLSGETSGRFSGPNDARLNAVPPPASLGSVNVTPRRRMPAVSPLAAGPSSQSRPLDPAVDQDREYFTLSKSKDGRRIRIPHISNAPRGNNVGASSRVIRLQAQPTKTAGRGIEPQRGPVTSTVNTPGQMRAGGPPAQRIADATQNALTSASAAAFSQAVKPPPQGFLAHIPPGPRPAPSSKAAAVAAKAKAPITNAPRKILEPKAPSKATAKNSIDSNSQPSVIYPAGHSAELPKSTNGQRVVSDLGIPPKIFSNEDPPSRIEINGRWYVLDTKGENSVEKERGTSIALKSPATAETPSVASSRIQVSQNISISATSLIGNHLLPMGTNEAARSKGSESLANSRWASNRKSYQSPSANVEAGLTPQNTLQLARREPPRPVRKYPDSPRASAAVPYYVTAMDMESRPSPSHSSGEEGRPSPTESFETPFQVPPTAGSTLAHGPRVQKTAPPLIQDATDVPRGKAMKSPPPKTHGGMFNTKSLRTENKPVQTNSQSSDLRPNSGLESSKWAPPVFGARKSNVGQSISGNIARNVAKKAPKASILGDSRMANKSASVSGLEDSIWAK